MDAARKLNDDTIPFVPRAQNPSPATPLQISMNPFVAGANGSRMGRPLQTAFGEVIRQIGLQAPVVVVVGSSGTGKSLLMDMTARACLGMGLSVRRVERGDQVHTAFGAKSDVLLVDQTDSMSNTNLQALLTSGKNTAATMVFMCLPTSVGRFSFSDAQGVTIELTPLALSDCRNYLQERATSIGRPNLFAPEALDLAIDGSRGLPRLLRSIAHLAFLSAASEGAVQIGTQHISNTSETRGLQSHHIGAEDEASPQTFEHATPAGTRPVANARTSPAGGAIDTVSQKLAVQSPVTPSTDEIRHDRPPAFAHPAREAVAAKPAPEFRRAERETESWIPRAVTIGGLLATVTAVAAIMFMSGKPDLLRVPSGSVTIARPVEPKPAPVQSPVPVRQTAAPIQPAQHAGSPKNTSANRAIANPAGVAKPTKVAPVQAAAPAPSVQVQAKAPPVPEPIAPAAAVQIPTVQETATLKPAGDKIPVQGDDANRLKPAEQAPATITTADQAPPEKTAAEQAAALKAAADRAEEAKAAAIRTQAAERAFLIAQEAGRQAQAAREAAEQDKAKKDADDRARTARQNANRQFSNSLLGVGH